MTKHITEDGDKTVALKSWEVTDSAWIAFNAEEHMTNGIQGAYNAGMKDGRAISALSAAARPMQTIMDGENGNCLQAAVSMITGRPLVEVPNFSTFRSNWFEAIMLWAESAGFEVIPVNPHHWGEPVLAFGQSLRGLRHCVVWLDGGMLHDPHPDGTGLVSVESEFWAITPTDPQEGAPVDPQ